MKTTQIALCASLTLLVLLGSSAAAQEPGGLPQEPEFSGKLPPLPTATPEMWYYAQEIRRYDDPKQAVRRKAEWKANQRRYRLAALKWFGFSNSRPQASASPFYTGTYSPTWVGNSWDPYRWIGSGSGTHIYITNDVSQ